MLINNFLSSRKSVRSFKSRKIGASACEKIREMLRIYNADKSDSNIFFFHENGENIAQSLNGYAGYNGVMIDAPSYISIDLGSSSDRERVMGMYRAESLISFLENEGLGSCWVGVFDTPKEVLDKVFGSSHTPTMLLAIGYPKPANPFVVSEASERKPVDEIVFKDEIGNKIELQELEMRGLDDLFYYVRFAPNTLNSQTWRFVLKGNEIELYLTDHNGKYYYEDAGIIMYYFERMYELAGYKKNWKVFDEFEDVNGYKKIATISL
ncbi:MAG: nitroreductase family protein [Ezakiella sp.]|nr:nitroreductase [Ezakiella sp.]MDD7761834.1 nitroreductase family protein [Bacillota bacterium]MDY3946649.1 nitroreductase family protein [Ezakiella sp.]